MEYSQSKALKQIKDIVEFSPAKLVLPVIIVAAFSSSAFITLDYMESPDFEEITDERSKAAAERAIIEAEHELYPEESGIETDEQLRDRLDEAGDPRSLLNPRRQMIAAPLQFSLNTYLVPFTPELTSGRSSTGNELLISDKTRQMQIERRYILTEMIALQEEANQTGMSYEEFRNRTERLNYDEATIEDLRPEMRDDLPDLREVEMADFAPAMASSFLLYYLFSGLALVGWRDFKRKAEANSRHENFFRNNFVLGFSGAALSLLALKFISGSLSASSFTAEQLLFFVLAVTVWTPLYAAVQVELKNFTKYSWLLTGVAVNIVLVGLTFILPFNEARQIVTGGATPLYPLVLGCFCEYGRIHGENFLRDRLGEAES